MITIVLVLILFVILLLPLLVKKVEHNLELFLLIAGVVTLLISHLLGREPLLSLRFAESVFMEPVKLTVATLVFGLVFRAIREPLKKKIVAFEIRLGPQAFAFLLILILGLTSSVVTAIIAALILCEIVSDIKLDKNTKPAWSSSLVFPSAWVRPSRLLERRCPRLSSPNYAVGRW
jgi:predicted cation transporter